MCHQTSNFNEIVLQSHLCHVSTELSVKIKKLKRFRLTTDYFPLGFSAEIYCFPAEAFIPSVKEWKPVLKKNPVL